MLVLASACSGGAAVRAYCQVSSSMVVDMLICGWFSASACRNFRVNHVGSDGSTVGDRIRDAGYTTFPQAENIAKGQTSAHQVSRHVF
jgi:hypothetical protein